MSLTALTVSGGASVLVVVVASRLCVKLLGGGLLVSRPVGFPLAQVVAALVLLPHAVHQQQDQEDGEQESDHSTSNHSC